MGDTSKQPPVGPEPGFPPPLARVRLYEQVAEQISAWIGEHGLEPGDKLPAERELASRLGVSRATLSQALVALEVIGVVAVRHGDGTIVAQSPGASRIVETVRTHAHRLPEIIETRDALETRTAGLAAARRTEADLHRIEEALAGMEADIAAGGRGVEGDENFRAAVTAAAHSLLLSQLLGEIADSSARHASSRCRSLIARGHRSPAIAQSRKPYVQATPRAQPPPCTPMSRWSATSG